MRTLKTLRPGQKGTRELMTRFGSSLLRVRYRYDENTRERLKTVELVIQRRCRKRPAASRPSSRNNAAMSRKVASRIGWREVDLRRRVKSAGGRWDPTRKVWVLQRDFAERLDLLCRIVGGG